MSIPGCGIRFQFDRLKAQPEALTKEHPMSIDIVPSFSLDMDDVPSVNMSNGNAVHILGILGFTREDIEEIATEGREFSPMDLTSRLLLAGVFSENVEERPTVREGNWVNFGTDAAYIERKLGDIKAVVYWADQHGKEVSIY
jgi:hypothetical protein